MDHDHAVDTCRLHGHTEQADPNCTHCGGSGWIGDIACPCTTT
ncbi:hypothetical protein OG244_19350 [Streptomyces brevispora]|nr:hypothetical protein [Streptomyces brevispora]